MTMREILFRGKQKDSGEWVYGGIVQGVVHELWQNAGRAYILVFPEFLSSVKLVEVDPDTVCQYTGLTDKNGKRIFEGDIVQNADGYLFSAQYPFAVKFCNGNFCGDAGGFVYVSGEDFHFCEVIGNIHDNPELLEVDE